jgi:putative CocE/NonD family hydrolase
MRRSLFTLPLLAAILVAQQPAPSLEGRWGGSVTLPNGQALGVSLVFSGSAPRWTGTFSAPDQGVADSPLSDIKVEGLIVTFTVPAVTGGLSIKSQLSEDGQKLQGSLTSNGRTLPFRLERDKVISATPNPVQARYTKQEVMIPMRDGVKLFTSIYMPKDASKAHPILLSRTPYSCSPYGADKYRRFIGPSPLFLEEDYIVVYQDVRGRWMSEGEFVDMRPVNPKKQGKDIDEGSDTYDTLEWLTKHLPNNNGKVGLWGISWPGHFVVQGMLSGHPSLVAVSPQAPMVDIAQGDDAYHFGGFELAGNFDFFFDFHSKREKPISERPANVEVDSPDGYTWFLKAGNIGHLGQTVLKGEEPVWDAWVKHTTYDAYWKARDMRPHLKDVKPAVLTVGGWFDAEDLFGPLATFRTLQRQSGATDHRIVMGPWTHGQWASGDGSRIGTAEFGEKTSAWFQKEVELRFFNHHLKGGPDPKLPKATMFETGANRWRSFETWPPKEAMPKQLYFQAKGKLSFAQSGQTAFEEFVADPAKPVPYTQAITFGYIPSYMIEDQRFAAARPDVVVFETEPLDSDVTFAGPVRPVLRVSTTGTDSDWVVKLIDVFPDDAKDPDNAPKNWHAAGYQMLVRGDAFRGKFRKSFSKPVAFTPGKPEEVAFTLPDVCHTFKKGHRIMVQVQCSWFPLIDRNPQTFCEIPNAKPEQFRKATQRVFLGGVSGSRLEVLELK